MSNTKKPTMHQIQVVKTMLDSSMRRRRDALEKSHPRPSWEDNDAWKRKHPDPRAKHDALMNRKTAPARKAIEDLMYQAKMGFISIMDFDKQARALAEKIAPRTITTNEEE